MKIFLISFAVFAVTMLGADPVFGQQPDPEAEITYMQYEEDVSGRVLGGAGTPDVDIFWINTRTVVEPQAVGFYRNRIYAVYLAGWSPETGPIFGEQLVYTGAFYTGGWLPPAQGGGVVYSERAKPEINENSPAFNSLGVYTFKMTVSYEYGQYSEPNMDVVSKGPYTVDGL